MDYNTDILDEVYNLCISTADDAVFGRISNDRTSNSAISALHMVGNFRKHGSRRTLVDAINGILNDGRFFVKLAEIMKRADEWVGDGASTQNHNADRVYKFSEETRRKMSEAHKGKHLKASTRRKMSKAHKGNKMFCKNGKRVFAKVCPDGFVPVKKKSGNR